MTQVASLLMLLPWIGEATVTAAAGVISTVAGLRKILALRSLSLAKDLAAARDIDF
jgi:hypothetical protein